MLLGPLLYSMFVTLRSQLQGLVPAQSSIKIVLPIVHLALVLHLHISAASYTTPVVENSYTTKIVKAIGSKLTSNKLINRNILHFFYLER